MPESEYDTVLRSLGIDEATLVTDDKGTVNVGKDRIEDLELDTSLPKLVLAGPDQTLDIPADLRLKHTIGTGTTATVWAAAQPSLRRTVAVKQLRPNHSSARARAELLQEARITGNLEHPNIVPVHGLGVTEDQSPLLIMKYIEGTPWRTSFEPLYATADAPAPELVERQLRVLLAVTTAAHFGHGHGVLHRDLKPENIMLGLEDEVYVVDWGLAVALRSDVDLPLADEVRSIAGTPGYMAPEMAGSDGKSFCPSTDVYLLGAILHELVTGEKRHEGVTVIEQLAAAYQAAPHEYPPWVPAEVAEICNRACHKRPGERFEDAGAFRRAIEAFLSHRGSRELAEEANVRLDRLRDAMRGGPSQDPNRSTDPATWNRWSTEARFGYRQALREWPENFEARDGLQELLELLIARELQRDNPKAAAELASELPEPNEALEAEIKKVERRVRKRHKDAEDLAQFRHDQDLRVSLKTRRRVTLLDGFALLLGTGVLFTLRITGIHEPGYPDLVVVTILVAIVMVHGERRVAAAGDNEINRKLLGGITRIAGAVAALFCVCWIAGVDIVHAESIAMLVVAMGAVMLSHTVDGSLGWAAAGFLVTSLGVLAAPDLRGLVIGVGTLGSLSIGARAWRRRVGAAPDPHR